jgi:hypothetical protein
MGLPSRSSDADPDAPVTPHGFLRPAERFGPFPRAALKRATYRGEQPWPLATPLHGPSLHPFRAQYTGSRTSAGSPRAAVAGWGAWGVHGLTIRPPPRPGWLEPRGCIRGRIRRANAAGGRLIRLPFAIGAWAARPPGGGLPDAVLHPHQPPAQRTHAHRRCAPYAERPAIGLDSIPPCAIILRLGSEPAPVAVATRPP